MTKIQLPQNLDNLLNKTRPPALKELPINDANIDAFFTRAEQAIADSSVEGVSHHSRFIMAYEGVFAGVMGTLAAYGLRPGDGEGHRAISLQAAISALGLQQKNPMVVAQVERMHQTRNSTIYRSPIPPVGKADFDLAQKILKDVVETGKKLNEELKLARSAANVAVKGKTNPTKNPN